MEDYKAIQLERIICQSIGKNRLGYKNQYLLNPLQKDDPSRSSFALQQTEDKMINWFNIPDEGLSNGGLFEVKELEVTENGAYETKGEMYNKVTVNVEGGGGSSDFSTARVAILNASGKLVTFSPFARILGDEIDASPYNVMSVSTPQDCYAVLYRGQTYITFDTEPPTTENIATEGGVEYDESDGTFIITGDCTITIS